MGDQDYGERIAKLEVEVNNLKSDVEDLKEYKEDIKSLMLAIQDTNNNVKIVNIETNNNITNLGEQIKTVNDIVAEMKKEQIEEKNKPIENFDKWKWLIIGGIISLITGVIMKFL